MTSNSVWVIVSREAGVHGVYTKEEVAQFVCDKIDGRIARRPKIIQYTLIKSLTDAGYSIYDKGGSNSIYDKKGKVKVE